MNIPLGNSVNPSVPPMLGRNVDGSLSDRMQTILPTNEGSGLVKEADLSKINSLIGSSNNNSRNDDFDDLKKLNCLLPTRNMKKPTEPSKSITDENPNKLDSSNRSPATSSSEAHEKVSVAKKRKPRKKWKKPKDKPNRPLSAYNLFFQQERALMLEDSYASKDVTKDEASSIPINKGGRRIHRKTHGKVGFAEMARSIGAKWKALPDANKEPFIKQASKEKLRYAKELAAWKEQQKIKEQEAGIRIAANNASNKPGLSNGVDALSMSTDAITRQRLAFLQDASRGSQDLSTLNLLRALQGQQQPQQQQLQQQQLPENNSMNSYPNAAEASANAIFQQFQGMLSQQQTPQPSELNPFLLSSTGGISGGNDMPSSSSLSLAEQLQLNTVAQQRMQLERLQMQQLLLQNQIAMSNVAAQAPVCNNTSFDTLQQQMNPNFNSSNHIGNNNRDFSQLGGFFPNQQRP